MCTHGLANAGVGVMASVATEPAVCVSSSILMLPSYGPHESSLRSPFKQLTPIQVAKWPRWFTPNCRSKPSYSNTWHLTNFTAHSLRSLVSCRSGMAITPALFMRTSMWSPPSPRSRDF